MNTKSTIKNVHGFTLVELMVAVFLSAIAVIAIYRGYTSFSQTADAQEQMIEMQQNLRIGMQWLEKDIRRAFMNEEDDENAGFPENDDNDKCCSANAIAMTMDLTGGESDGVDNDHDDATDGADTDNFPFNESAYGDGVLDDAGEEIGYYLVYDDPATGVTVCPAAFDAAKYPCFLCREDVNVSAGVSNCQKLIANVDALDFIYLDEDRNVLPFGAGGLLDDGDKDDIAIIQTCLVVRTTNEDYRYTNDEPYENIRPVGAGGPQTIFTGPGDNFRRRVFCQEIKIRNAGL